MFDIPKPLTADERKKLVATAKEDIAKLMSMKSQAELDKRFLKSFGCINFFSYDDELELERAKEYHRQLEAMPNSRHHLSSRETFRSYEELTCPACKFSYAIDSSD